MNKKAILKAYMVYSSFLGAYEGACLVFAYSAKEARKLGYPIIDNWFDIEWIDCRAKWIKSSDWLFEEKIKDSPHVIESPQVCDICNIWGNEPYDNNICVDCQEFLGKDL